MYFNCKQGLLITTFCLSATTAHSTTIFTPTDGDINFSVTTGQVNTGGYTLAIFDDLALSGGVINGAADHLTVSIPELINWDFTQTLSNTNTLGTLDIGTDGQFILAVQLFVEGGWIGGDPDHGSMWTVPETNQYAIKFGDIGGFDLVVDIAPVPVPAAVWLFGSGLLGLVGVARRKKA